MIQNQNFFIYLLKHAKGIGNIGLLKIIQKLMEYEWPTVSVEELAFFAELRMDYRRKFSESFTEILQHEEEALVAYEQIKMLTILDSAYPDYLREVYNPPVALFFKGNLEWLKPQAIAMIGSRAASNYGKKMVEELVPKLVNTGFVMVSGLAKGIDTYAHQTTIRNHGRTIGVIGAGLDVVYPKENNRLQEYIGKHHLLLSEYPLGTKPLPFHFPERNRIIAGLCQGTCVVEAKEKSGTFITAQIALESGRDVFAVPGNISDGLSNGCHSLIQQGAKCVWNSQHIIEEMQYFS